MLDDLIAAYGQRFAVAAIGVALALLCLFVVLWLLRRRSSSPFVRGGRNRQPRLQVLDAAAVDTRRRIVLIRRDNVEHLVMIGGPTDVVIESGIGEERNYISVGDLPQTKLAADQTAEMPLAAPTKTAPPLAPASEQQSVARVPAEAAFAPATTAAAQTVPTPAAPKQDAPPVTIAPAPVARPDQAATSTTAVDPDTDVEAQTPISSATEAPVARPLEADQASSAQAPESRPEPKPYQEAPITAAPLEEAAEGKRESAQSLEPEEQSFDDILDAARNRVLQPQPGKQQETAGEAQRQTSSSASDFERILEAEMNSHLAESIPAPAPQARRPYQPTVMPPGPRASAPSIAADPRLRDVRPVAPAVAPPTGNRQPAPQAAPQPATNKDEPNLQTEIARIFGEMSAKRD